jgi:hypothetical protein
MIVLGECSSKVSAEQRLAGRANHVQRASRLGVAETTPAIRDGSVSVSVDHDASP